jgi:hypothetical protein
MLCKIGRGITNRSSGQGFALPLNSIVRSETGVIYMFTFLYYTEACLSDSKEFVTHESDFSKAQAAFSDFLGNIWVERVDSEAEDEDGNFYQLDEELFSGKL